MNKQLAYLLGRVSRCKGVFSLYPSQKKLLDAFRENQDIFQDLEILKSKHKRMIQVSYNLVKEGNLLVVKDFSREYIQGLFEGTNNRGPDHLVKVNCCRDSGNTIQEITGAKGVYDSENSVLLFSNHNALDFLDYVYKNGPSGHSRFCYSKYIKLTGSLNESLLEFRYTKVADTAVPPFKTRASDSGFDLVLTKLIKNVGNTYWYSTELAIEPPNGYYFDMVPRSSLVKSGYMLGNSVGVIDRSYTGQVMAVLYKVDSTAPDLKLPCRAVQIIPRRIVHMNPINVDSLSESERGCGGFGSTG